MQIQNQQAHSTYLRQHFQPTATEATETLKFDSKNQIPAKDQNLLSAYDEDRLMQYAKQVAAQVEADNRKLEQKDKEYRSRI